jgi:DNA-binding GntR family transcriptional regulator
MLLRDTIYDTLRAEILLCRLAPGEELRELDLAEKYEVSRSPIREALRRLQSDRLVTVLPRQCYVVNAISVSEAEELYRFRAVLEPACAAEVVRRASEAELEALMQQARVDPDADFIVANRDFHCALARASGNPRMADAACELIEQCDRLVRVVGSTIRGRVSEQLAAEHLAVAAALQARDGRGAGRRLYDHISQAEKRIVAALRRQAVRD